ncbi:MAG: hypothetical protein FJZ04_01715 [Candidatus Moranbacteria bacterium]|nr:hypothetical protein [Candidatus Moranbacteria bacterium]
MLTKSKQIKFKKAGVKVGVLPLALIIFLWGNQFTLAADTDAIQNIAGEVSTTGSYNVNLGGGKTATVRTRGSDGMKKTWQISDGMLVYPYYGEGSMNLSYNLKLFDEQGNFNQAEVTGALFDTMRKYEINYERLCFGDNDACKNESWDYVYVTPDQSIVSCGFECSHLNKYIYNFRYEVKNSSGSWELADSSNINKCQETRVVFSPQAEWFGKLDHRCLVNGGPLLFTVDLSSPPTSLLTCADSNSCFSQVLEYPLTNLTFGKGVQKIPENFVSNTQNSLISSNPYARCQGGICAGYAHGEYIFSTKADASSYIGQCRGKSQEETINDQKITSPEVSIVTNEVPISQVSNSFRVQIINRPPLVNVSFAKNPVAVNEEVEVICDISDPDVCSDKIAKIKWACVDASGGSDNCYLESSSSGGLLRGSAIQEIISSNQSNPFQAKVKMKASAPGAYAVTCEAWDNDPVKPLSGVNVASVAVTESGADGDSGYIPARFKNCFLFGEGRKDEANICPGRSNEVVLEAVYSGMTPVSYDWKCGDGTGAKSTSKPRATCVYPLLSSGEKHYLPSLTINYDGGKESCTTVLRVNSYSDCGVIDERTEQNTSGNDNKNDQVRFR